MAPQLTNTAEEKKHAAGAREVIRVYARHLSKYRLPICLLFLGTLLMQAANLAVPLFLRQFFNVLAVNAIDTATVHVLVQTLVVIGSLWALNWLGNRIQDFSNMYMSARIMHDLYDEAFEYLIKHSYNFFVSSFTGSLTNKVGKFSRNFETIWDGFVLQFIPTILFVIGAIVVLSLHNLVLGLGLAAWSVVFVSFQVYVTRLRQPFRTRRSEADTRITGTLSDAISNQNTIALFSGQAYESSLFRDVVGAWRKATLRYWYTDGAIFAAIGLFVISIQVGLLGGAVYFWSHGALTVGDFVLIQSYLLGVFSQLMGINFQLRRFYDAFADAGEMVAILQTPHEIKDKKGAKRLHVNGGEVWFDDVSFDFHKGTPILHQFNLTIAGGERVALVGPSGAGKSTVTKLLLRLYDVPKGEVKIDKQDISKVTQDSLRDAISFVPQEPVLFHRSLMENIRYGYRDATDEQVIEAAKKAHCHEFISRLPLGYETFVGERGIKLSGGERQRVAIARAILKDAPILVLDEATSSLDSESEALIQDALNILMEGKTVAVIAHRLSTIMKMDRIVVMEGGQIVAQGTHLQLIKEKGLYQKLWSIQAGGFIGVDDEEQAPLESTIEEDDDLAESPKEK